MRFGYKRRIRLANGSTDGREITNVGERCNIVILATSLAIAGTIVIAVAPEPITTTLLLR